MLTGLQKLVDVFGEIFKGFRGELGPCRGQAVIVEDVNDDPASMSVLRVQPVPASAGMRR